MFLMMILTRLIIFSGMRDTTDPNLHVMDRIQSSVDHPPLTGDLWVNLWIESHPTATILDPDQGNLQVTEDFLLLDTVSCLGDQTYKIT